MCKNNFKCGSSKELLVTRKKNSFELLKIVVSSESVKDFRETPFIHWRQNRFYFGGRVSF
jgi:hypothetical protein